MLYCLCCPGQAMVPPPVPARPPSPIFVPVPPRQQKLLHSEAYLKWVISLFVFTFSINRISFGIFVKWLQCKWNFKKISLSNPCRSLCMCVSFSGYCHSDETLNQDPWRFSSGDSMSFPLLLIQINFFVPFHPYNNLPGTFRLKSEALDASLQVTVWISFYD